MIPRAPVLPLLAVLFAGCSRSAPEMVVEVPTLSVTRWTDSTELYLEHPALIAGQTIKFAVHLTDLTDFRPLLGGTVVLRLTPAAGGKAIEATQGGPSSPGIYGPTLTPERAGRYRVTVLVNSPQTIDSIAAGEAEVFESADDAPTEPNAPAGIAFLKEQQWKTDAFRTTFAVEGSLAGSTEVPGEIVAAAGREAVVTAPIAGVITDRGAPAIVPGARVSAGAVLSTLAPALGSDAGGYPAARAALAEAEEERARAARLVAAEAAPARRLHEAEIRLRAAREALQAYGGGELVDGKVPVRAPIGGVVVSHHLLPGSRVDAGSALATIVDPSVVWLRVLVPAAVATGIDRRRGATFRIDGTGLAGESTAPLPVVPVIDPASRAVTMYYPVANRDGAIPIGATVRAMTPSIVVRQGVIVPASALFEYDGVPTVFVQTAGERFDQRAVVVGARSPDRVLLTGGIAAGERVVTSAAYQIRLASQSSIVPAHGHEH